MLAGCGQDGLGVELHPLYRIRVVTDPHALPIVTRLGRYLQARWERCAVRDEGVVAGGDERILNTIISPEPKCRMRLAFRASHAAQL